MRFLTVLLAVMLLSGCGAYNRVYYKSMDEVSKAFDINEEGVRVKQITDSHHKYKGYYEVRYKPF